MNTTLNNGATVIEQSGRIVIASWHGEYITWEVTDDGDAYWGHYYHTLAEALHDYQERIA